MKKTLLILSMITLIFAGCKKFDEIEASKVEIMEEKIEKGWDYIKIDVEYDYPVALEAVTLYLSEKEDMSGAEVYECSLEGKKYSVELDSLKAGVAYYYCYEYDNGYEKEKGGKKSMQTISKPVVVTKDITSITTISATLNGNLTNSDAANKITEKGFCWGTEKEPTIEGNHISKGSGTGTYSYSLTNLTNNTTYYVRAYVKTNFGIVYGEEKSFTTVEIVLPTVTTTAEVAEITHNSATCGGEVTFDGNVSVTARGICWSTSQNPTIEDNKTTDGSGVGIFTSQIPNLVPNTQYYVRAYATNEVGTAYGEEVTFTTLEKLLPTVTTATEVTDITLHSAKCGGEVTFDGNVEVTARGICWSTTQNPTIEDNKTTDGSGVGIFTSQIPNLVPNTQYYVRAYATNDVGTAYGEEVSFTTLERNANGHTYVDLGLSSGLLWATCNVGATTPEEYGDYYAWGETTTKETYTKDNCATYNVSMNDISGNAQYDAATANWGGNWRMPTYDELKELKDNCIWTWTTRNGVKGYNVEGPNGNSIFLPAIGYRIGSSLYNAGLHGFYWSSEPYGSSSDGAYDLFFGSDFHYMNYFDRNYGLSVRPVLE